MLPDTVSCHRRLWISLRDRLNGWLAFEHHGLDALPSALHEKANLLYAKQQAARARKLQDRLFGSNGVAFVQQPFFDKPQPWRRCCG